MLKSGILLTAISVFVMLLPSTLHAQSRPGTVGDSWKSAPAQSTQGKAPATGTDAAAWNKERTSSSRPWPQLPEKPMSSDYYKVNTMVIDSLSRLYCVSSSYLHTLRQRNEKASSKPAVSSKDGQGFQYNQPTAAAPPPQGHESPQALYRELTSLLDRCLHGR